MTSLAHQLKRLALPQNDPSLLSRSEAASLLFDCKEAANIDRDTFFAIGCTGLEELIGIDPSFEIFETTLFSQISKGLERSVQTKAVNQQLDENISLFLIHLSPYFMLKPAQKCLEWLIHRFHIHLYNQDSLIGCVLPYHETKLFVRVIQLLKISDPTHKWHWLHPIQKPGVPLARGTLITHCHKDLGFLDFLCNLVTKSVKVFSQYPGSSSQLRVLLTFYASTVVSALGAVANVTDTLVSRLLPYIQKGLKSPLVDFRAATYMIICQLTVRVTMEQSLVRSLMLLISKTLTKTPSLVKEGLCCLIVLLQSQKEEGLGEKPYVHLCNVPDLIAILHEISAVHSVGPILHYLLPHLVHSAIYGKAEGSHAIDNQIYIKHLEAILTTIPLEKDLDHLLATTLGFPRVPYGFFFFACRRYSRTLDLVLEKYLKNIRNQKEQDLFHQFISLSVSGGKYQFLEDSNTSLLLSLNHSQPGVRVLAVQHLKEIIETSKEGFDDSFIQEAIVARLKDDNLDVSALVHLNIFSEQIGFSLLSLFERADLSKDKKWCKILETILCLLMKVDTIKDNKDLFNQLVLHLLPFLVITNKDLESAEGRVAICITESGLCSLHPLLKGWPKGFINLIIVILLQVEGFISLIEKESPTGKQKLIGHIISFVLVQSCCSCSQMGDRHLFLALRIFHFLSKKMDSFKDNCPSEEVRIFNFKIAASIRSPILTHSTLDLCVCVYVYTEFSSVDIGERLHDTNEVWWNPETLNADSKDYMHLLLGLFDIIVRGASEGFCAGHFRAMMRLLFEVHLKGPEHQFRFLSILWTYNYNLCNQLNFVMDAVLQTRALYIGCVMLESQPKQKKRQLVSTASPVIVSLLINLGSPVSEVRRASLKCLHSLSGIEESIFHPVLQSVTKKAEEIMSDSTYVTQVLGDLFGGEPTQPKRKAKQQKSSEALTALLECVQGFRCPSYIARNLMKILHEVNGNITKPFFAALPEGKVQQRILGVLFDLLLNCKNLHCAQTISSVFKGISVDAEQLCIELEPQPKVKAAATVHQTRRQKIQQKVQVPECVQEESINWQRITLILELLQHKKKLKQPQALIPTLFNLLSRCLEPTTGEENLEYTKQLILGSLLNICQKLSPDSNRIKAGLLDEEKFNVELIVQCIRISEMPQTHHHALLLLGTAAGMFPDKVLHNIMPIFTFMGANVMRLDDAYSFQVINKTVKMVIPALIQEDGRSSGTAGNMEGVVIKIIRVFVDALPHVPEHRRLPILEQLTSTLGAERFLWILLVLLFEQHVTKSGAAVASGEKDIVLETDTEFWISVCCEFSVIEQLQSLMKLLNYLTNLPENKEETELFDVESHSGKQLRHLKFLAVSFMSQLLASNSFVKKLVIQYGCFSRLLEKILCYINAVAQSIEKNANTLTAKFWKVLLNKSYELLDKINSLIPTETFIPVLRGLMINQLPSVRRKAMDLLNNKLQQNTQWKPTQVELLLELVPDLLTVVRHQEAEEQAINRQTALYSLKLLCKCFGREKHELFVDVLKVAIEVISADGKEERNIVGSALLCAAEVTCVLKALAIPQLPRLMPALLNILKHKKDLVANEIYLLSTVTALLKIVETLPRFLSPYLLNVLLQVVHLDRITVEMGPSSQINLRVASLKTTLATKLPSRVLLPAIVKCYSEIANASKNDVGTIMDILKEHIVTLEKAQLSAHQSELTAFFTKALNFRAEHSQDNLEKVGKIEARIITCLISMVMKLSEMSFRPLFFKLFDWSRTEGAPKDRQLTFYRLADCIAGELKGLFSLFAGHLVKPFADNLNQINTSKTDEAYFDSGGDTEKSCLLLQYSLDCLYKIFLFDSHHFVSKERAETLMLPLVNQLENMLGGEERFQERVSMHLIPCMAQFAVAMADDALWKPLNYQILLKMRHASPKVRFAALLALLELAEKIRENYMVLLPESIPFLAELMEDECEEVEHQCQKTIQQLEIILGEPLQSYF
uniref:HEAT repeat-containing protein 1 n=1 Tax=Pseudonaja textilis TaxID=8673 RepID=A0A670XZV7_PSETE